MGQGSQKQSTWLLPVGMWALTCCPKETWKNILHKKEQKYFAN